MNEPSPTSNGTLRILFLNSHGGGFADHLNVPAGTTIAQLIERQLPHVKADDLLIRVNRQPVQRDYVLQADDRVSATPTKIAGAVVV
ncbi:molybdopterin converting factor [Phycisphaerales bacterium AB-hyl4]|uniref:Molybdopterin converting factor n=1 Tax=Natronomicrosphaera hydrolytica TaxID=3242702 RepID=A0ABV4U970_9BACT